MKSAFVSTRFASQVMLPVASTSRIICASLGSSSRHRMRKKDFIFWSGPSNASRGRLVDNGPKDSELLHGVYKFMKIHGLHDISVNAHPVACHHVFFFMGRSEDDHRNRLELLFRLDPLQNLQPIDLRQFQIEEKDRRVPIRAGSELAPAMEVVQGLLAIMSNHHLVSQV